MTRQPTLPLYTADRQSDADFVRSFVLRHEVLEQILAILGGIGRGDIDEHPILIGARGMGKSTLLRRIAIEVGNHPQLRDTYIPLRLREEQYNVIGLSAFWGNTLEALAAWADNTGRQTLAERIDIQLATRAKASAEELHDLLTEIAAEIGSRPLLLVDNLDLILNALPEADHWALRGALQAPGGPVLLGAAIALPRQGADRDAAFYEFFQPRFLEPLTFEAMIAALRSAAAMRGPVGETVSGIIAAEPARLRTLHALTAATPRVLAMLYCLSERGETATAFADLEALLDQVTPWYKPRIEDHASPQQRAIIDTIALNWDPITSHDLAAATGIEITTISSQLNRLRRDGFIEEVDTSGSRSGYQIGERFLNIWYLMRHGNRRALRRLKGLTEFLTRFHADPPASAAVAEALRSATEALAADNFGAMTAHLARALDDSREASPASPDLLHLLELAAGKGYGEKLIGWFAESGREFNLAPLTAAFRAHVRGEPALLDACPEIRHPAAAIYARLTPTRPPPQRPSPRSRRGHSRTS